MHDAYTGFFLGISSVKFCFFWRWDWMWWVCIDMEEGRRRKEGRNWSERLLSVLVKYLDDKTKQQPDMCDVWVTALRSDREQVRDWVTLAVINSSQSVKVYTEMLSREMELFGFGFFCHVIWSVTCLRRVMEHLTFVKAQCLDMLLFSEKKEKGLKK